MQWKSGDDGRQPAGPAQEPDQLIRQWRETFESQVTDLSTSPEWMGLAATAAGLADRFHLVAVRRGERLVGIAGFVEATRSHFGARLRSREMPSDELVVYHNEWAGAEAEQVVEEVARAGGHECDLIYVPAVPTGGDTHRRLTDAARRNRWTLLAVPGYRSPYLPLAGTWDEFLAGKSSNFRYTLKRKQRALEKLGSLEERWFEDAGSIGELLECITRIEASSWKADADMAISGRAAEEGYYRALLPWLAGKGALLANVLSIAGEPCAYSLCCHWNGRVAQLKTSFAEKFAEASPGLAVNAAAIREAFRRRAGEFDFLGDVMPHKMHWTSQVRPHDNLFLFTRTLRGRWVGRLKRLAGFLRRTTHPVTRGRGKHRQAGPAQ